MVKGPCGTASVSGAMVWVWLGGGGARLIVGGGGTWATAPTASSSKMPGTALGLMLILSIDEGYARYVPPGRGAGRRFDVRGGEMEGWSEGALLRAPRYAGRYR